MKSVTILGCTGSIGTQTLDVIAAYPDKYKVCGLVCRSNVDLLDKQISRFSPQFVCVSDENCADIIRRKYKRLDVFTGYDGVIESAGIKCDVVVNALVGIDGLLPTLKAIESCNDVALANKETLVTGGEIVMSLAKEKGVAILPVDSEHSAVWQCLEHRGECDKIILTASGGAFRDYTQDMLESATAAQALKHPTWDMGKKVTIDCATMMNKGFEVIEAMRLFDKPAQDIEVLIHRQSIVHSMVKYSDGSIIAQLSYPDMKLPIQYALGYPNRGNKEFSSLDLCAQPLTFERPDFKRFPCLAIAYECAKAGGVYPAILNAADEILVDYFCRGLIKFYDISYYINKSIDYVGGKSFDSGIDAVLEADKITRSYLIDCPDKRW
ncbi:MAG: 1-deoxy-D-xylulose-5-phosphate reductoisomerase [Clostridia bacterium]|nr:1-deoxy-D-xylulose-5-phosphate reductoisomerase [Clostridia bacterium]